MNNDKFPILISPKNKNEKIMDICWMLHGACNNRCSYCDPNNYEGMYGNLNLDNAISFIDQLFDHYHFKNTWRFFFTGGEPTLWPEFTDLCKYIKQKNNDAIIGVNTNGSKSKLFWKEISPYLNHIVVSYHPEFPRDENLIDWIGEVGNEVHVAVRLMMHNKNVNWQRSLAFGKKLEVLKSKLNCIYVEYVPIRENFGLSTNSYPMKYSEEQDLFWKNEKINFLIYNEKIESPNLRNKRSAIKRLVTFSDGSREELATDSLILNNQVNFEKWECSVGLDLLFINSYGKIFRSGCQVEGRIGNINDKKIRFPTESVICPFNYCPCGTDLEATKKHQVFRESSGNSL